MLNFITQHPVISLIAFIIATDFVYSTIRLFVWSLSRKGGKSMSKNDSFSGKTVTIEGNHHSVSINNGKLFIDGKLYMGVADYENYEIVKVIINGNVDNIDGTTVEVNGDVSGDIDGTNITVSGNVGGNIDGTNVTVGSSVHGSIDATIVSR